MQREWDTYLNDLNQERLEWNTKLNDSNKEAT
jgi:hypothetical protein